MNAANDGMVYFRITRSSDGRVTRCVEALINGHVVGKVPATRVTLDQRAHDLGEVGLYVHGYRAEFVQEPDA